MLTLNQNVILNLTLILTLKFNMDIHIVPRVMTQTQN